MKEIVISPATLCVASLLIAILADEARQFITLLRAPRFAKPYLSKSANLDKHMAPSTWVRIFCAPLDIIAFALLAIGLYNTSSIGMLIVNLCSVVFLAIIYIGIPKIFLDIFPNFDSSDRAKTRRERYYAKRAAVLLAVLIYRIGAYFAGLAPSQLWLWIAALMLFLIAFIRPVVESYWTKLGYDIEGEGEEPAPVSGE